MAAAEHFAHGFPSSLAPGIGPIIQSFGALLSQQLPIGTKSKDLQPGAAQIQTDKGFGVGHGVNELNAS